jgi:hypothetical protein
MRQGIGNKEKHPVVCRFAFVFVLCACACACAWCFLWFVLSGRCYGRGALGSTQFHGVLVGPPPVRKCHHSAGSSVGSSAHPPGATPRLGAGRCGRVRPVPPLLRLLLGLYSPRARLTPGWGSNDQPPPPTPPPLRASSRGALPGAGAAALAGYRTPIRAVCFTKAMAPNPRSGLQYCLASLRRAAAKAAPVANEVTGVTEY